MRSILRGIGYWHQVDAYAKLIAQRERAVPLRMPSLGAISSGLRVQYIWGVPRSDLPPFSVPRLHTVMELCVPG